MKKRNIGEDYVSEIFIGRPTVRQYFSPNECAKRVDVRKEKLKQFIETHSSTEVVKLFAQWDALGMEVSAIFCGITFLLGLILGIMIG